MPAQKSLLKSKTVWGGIIAGGAKIIGVIAPALMSGAFGPKAQEIATGAGIILGAVGIRHALTPKR